jgi:F-type H+-transporting ATPase subunit gamma
MTHRHKLEHHRQSLEEIRDIMNSMKTLAYMETRKLSRSLDAQHAVVQNIEEAANDFLSFYPELLPGTAKHQAQKTVYIMIGTERGFCADFNHVLLKQLETDSELHLSDNLMLIVVGRKLITLLENNQQVIATLDGASVVEEVTALIQQIVNELEHLQQTHPILSVYCLYHDMDTVSTKQLLPPFQHLQHNEIPFTHPPLLNISPGDFLMELTEHYLFASLYEVLYTSLMQENHQRVTHLEGAINHLDDESAQLAQQCNMLRQEEIIEEIEVILLSASSLSENKS